LLLQCFAQLAISIGGCVVEHFCVVVELYRSLFSVVELVRSLFSYGGVVTVTLLSGGVVTLTLFVVVFSKVE
jgi:hypothetical protein